MERVEQMLQMLLDGQNAMQQDIGNMKEEISLIKAQQTEHGKILVALQHASETHKADIDQLNHKLASIEGEVKGIRKDLSTVELVTAHNMANIAQLKLAK